MELSSDDVAPLDLLDLLVLELEEELEEEENKLLEEDKDDDSLSRIGLRLVESSLCGILREYEEADSGDDARIVNANNCQFAAASLSVVLEEGDEEEDDDEDEDEDDDDEEGVPLI